MLIENFTKVEIDPNAKSNGLTIFLWACKKGHTKMTEVLIQNSSDLNVQLNEKESSGRTGFHLAIESGCLELVDILMKNSAQFGIELNAKDERSWTPFHLACIFGKTNIV